MRPSALQFAAISLLLSASTMATSALGAGFTIQEQGAKRLGTAMAGSGSSAADAMSAWFNPASMSLLGNQVSATASIIEPRLEFTDTGSVQTGTTGTAPLLPSGNTSDDAGSAAFVPGFSYVHQINDLWSYGLTLNSPFGLATDYDPLWTGRYQAVQSQIRTANLNPSLSFALTDQLSLGAGIDINYASAHLTNAIDFAAICAQLAGGSCPNGAMPGQGNFDGYVINEGNDVGYGYNLGALWQLDANTRVGLDYRSQIHHRLEGTSDFEAPGALGGFAALGSLGDALQVAFHKTGNSAPLVLPDSAGISFYHQFGSGQFSLVANADWTGWSSLDRLRINFDNPATTDVSQDMNWKNAWLFALGGEFNPNDVWTLRAGVSYDQSPVRNATLRIPRLPGSDRLRVALGVTRSISPTASVDFALTHDYIHNSAINHPGDTGDILKGRYDGMANTVSVQYNYHFV